MNINAEDGRFGLDMWTLFDNGEEAITEYSDDLKELVARAGALIAAGRFSFLVLSEWSPVAREWHAIEIFERYPVEGSRLSLMSQKKLV